jgi:glycosyltransferase involved in cell wall biosynthesis
LEGTKNERYSLFTYAVNHESAPLISIIVAVYNGKATLQQCIDSAAQQTYPNKELIIIDGGSKDGTVDLLNANREKVAYWISEPDSGIYNAWNKGLVQARGEWICFLGADDYLWDNTVLERMVEQLVMLPAAIRVAYGQIMQIGDDGRSHRKIGEPWARAKESFRFMPYMNIPHVGTMHRRSLFEQHGKFDESFRIAGDYELLLRELKTGDAVFIPDIATAGQRLGGISTDTANYLKTLREVRRAQRMHGQFLPSSFWLKEMAKEYLRLLMWKVFGERMAKKLLDLRRRSKGLPPHWTKT